MMISGKENIDLFRLVTLKGALKLEIVGMKRRGQSAYSIVKQELGLKGNKKRVLKQLEQHIQERQGTREFNGKNTFPHTATSTRRAKS